MPERSKVVKVRNRNGLTVERFAHTHALRTGYSAEAHGVPNPDGTRFMFASNWNGDKSSSIYSYVAEYTRKGGEAE